jgi:RNA polymerase sigma-70 factor, ECF subfamily
VTGVLAATTLFRVSDGSEDLGATDAELLESVGAGDRYALAQLYARHAPWLQLRLGRRCADHGLVDEVLQDTFVAVWRRPRGWSGDGEVAAWLWGIAVRRLTDGFRRRPAVTVALPGGEALGAGPSAEDELLAGGGYDAASAALRALPADLHAALRATVVDGLTTAEAGQRLGIPAGTVKTRVMRAKAVLRKALS